MEVVCPLRRNLPKAAPKRLARPGSCYPGPCSTGWPWPIWTVYGSGIPFAYDETAAWRWNAVSTLPACNYPAHHMLRCKRPQKPQYNKPSDGCSKWPVFSSLWLCPKELRWDLMVGLSGKGDICIYIYVSCCFTTSFQVLQVDGQMVKHKWFWWRGSRIIKAVLWVFAQWEYWISSQLCGISGFPFTFVQCKAATPFILTRLLRKFPCPLAWPTRLSSLRKIQLSAIAVPWFFG